MFWFFLWLVLIIGFLAAAALGLRSLWHHARDTGRALGQAADRLGALDEDAVPAPHPVARPGVLMSPTELAETLKARRERKFAARSRRTARNRCSYRAWLRIFGENER